MVILLGITHSSTTKQEDEQEERSSCRTLGGTYEK